MEKEIRFNANFKSIDRVQQSTISEEQLLWLKERVLHKMFELLREEFNLNCDIKIDLTADKKEIMVIMRNKV